MNPSSWCEIDKFIKGVNYVIDISVQIRIPSNLGKPQKKYFLSGMTTKRGGGRALTPRKITFKKLYLSYFKILKKDFFRH